MYSHVAQDKILNQISLKTDNTIDEILYCKGDIRQLAMDLLYRFGGLKNKDIGILMGIDYSTVSQGRKRFNKKRIKNDELDTLARSLEGDLSRIKI